MNLKRSLILPACITVALVAGSTVGALWPDPGVGTPTPAASAPFTLPPVLADAVQCEEDEPCWDCETHGNRVCGVMAEPLQASAWAVFDANGGAAQLLVNPQARVSLAGYSITDPYAQGVPELGVQQLALPGSGVWFIFTAQAV